MDVQWRHLQYPHRKSMRINILNISSYFLSKVRKSHFFQVAFFSAVAFLDAIMLLSNNVK